MIIYICILSQDAEDVFIRCDGDGHFGPRFVRCVCAGKGNAYARKSKKGAACVRRAIRKRGKVNLNHAHKTKANR